MFGTTVARITSGLTSMIKQLEEHEKAMFARFDKHVARAKAEQVKADDALAEADKAKHIAGKIGALLG